MTSTALLPVSHPATREWSRAEIRPRRPAWTPEDDKKADKLPERNKKIYIYIRVCVYMVPEIKRVSVPRL